MLITAIAVAFAAVILFLRRGLYMLPPATGQNDGGDGGAFSIIVAARNEAENLPACLDSLLSQNIPADRYEVIIADDRSDDATPQILCDAAAKHPNLRVVTITETPCGISPKKHAVTTAIAASKNEIIVFTDADCVVPPTWLSCIGKYFAEGADLVQGVTTYSYTPGMNRLFWGLQSVDFLSHGIIAAAAIAANLPINSNANNMAFRREAFERAGGYGGNENVVPGDDDQLLQRVWKYGRKIAFMTDQGGAVETAPTPNLSMLFEQRRRWGAVTVHYGVRQIMLLSAVFAFYLTIAATAVISVFSPVRYLPVFLSLMLVKFTGELALMIPGTRIFNKKHLRKYIVWGSIVHLPMVLMSVLFGVFGGFKWKGVKTGRKVKIL
ncbi:MAG: glycosyltransferase [Chitinispirillales bacterium]|jgi:cellulose synthase/poly-beta-1,6-N-acetylglucosamine synthase-like glycosyltransferase|nr:glycosyltransferase [Chitinispirillales bacterium]